MRARLALTGSGLTSSAGPRLERPPQHLMDRGQDFRMRVNALEGRVGRVEMHVRALPFALSDGRFKCGPQSSQPRVIHDSRKDEVAVAIESLFLLSREGRVGDTALAQNVVELVGCSHGLPQSTAERCAAATLPRYSCSFGSKPYLRGPILPDSQRSVRVQTT